MNEQTYQPPLLHNWALYHREKHQADAIEAGIGAYEQQVTDATDAVRAVTADCQQRIAEANQVYEQAKRAYAEQGRLHTLHTDNAAMHHRMVERECRDLNLPLPPEPPEAPPAGDGHITRPQALPAGVVPVWQEPPRPDPLTDPVFSADDGRAEWDAANRVAEQVGPIAGPVEAGNPFGPEDGEAPVEGSFPPGPAQEAEGNG